MLWPPRAPGCAGHIAGLLCPERQHRPKQDVALLEPCQARQPPLPAGPGHSPLPASLPAPHLINVFGTGRAAYAAHLHCTAGRAHLGGIFPYNLRSSMLPSVSDPAGWRCSNGGMSWSFPSCGIGSAAASWCFFSTKLMAVPGFRPSPPFRAQFVVLCYPLKSVLLLMFSRT